MRFFLKKDKVIPKKFKGKESDDDYTFIVSKLPEIPLPPPNPFFGFNPELRKMLLGKQLLFEDLPFSLEEIQQHYENGYLVYRKGIEIKKNSLKCVRCGTTDSSWFAEFPCARCGEKDVYCRKCLMMGRVSGCTPLISWEEQGINVSQNAANSLQSVDNSENRRILQWTGTLSEGQKQASDKVISAIKSFDELLVWAVAGAGKTEVLFAGIEEALSTGKRVCIATPRLDVVQELTPRMKKVFPEIAIASLFGGSEDRHEYAPLTITTTHQLLRFYQAFDVVIVDEVDAFPFSIDETLQYAVKQSRKSPSSLIYLTATPNKKWQRECKLGKRNFVTIPARFHRQPLPVPRFEWSGNWEKLIAKGRLPIALKKWIQVRLNSNKQALLFAPKISSMEKILPLLQKLHPKIEASHANDPNRKEKVMKMRNKEIPILLTTTILERGVTFPGIDVAVIGSEDRIFTESALVQIAGRVGRSAEFPTGEVIFFHFGKTEAMLQSRQQILRMNKEGIRKGLIDR